MACPEKSRKSKKAGVIGGPISGTLITPALKQFYFEESLLYWRAWLDTVRPKNHESSMSTSRR